MCTLTILPKKDGFILTSNRDEAKSRKPANFPKYKTYGGKKVLFPQDSDAFGSWIAMNDFRLVSLLNGAYHLYDHQAPYKKSRGIVLLDCFDYPDFKDYANNYDFEQIAPFTIVCLEYKTDLSIQVLRWDGKAHTFETLNPKKSHIFSSIPLYPKEIRNKREQLFAEFIQSKENLSVDDLVHFHKFGGDENNPIKLDDSHFVHTVSITSVQKKENNLQMQYHDLVQDEVKTEIYQ